MGPSEPRFTKKTIAVTRTKITVAESIPSGVALNGTVIFRISGKVRSDRFKSVSQ
jgi:hypothetical protein